VRRRTGTDLFSEELIRSYFDERGAFVERAWLVDLVEQHLANPRCRFVLLTGEPGSGKSAFMAWLARRGKDRPRYFIRRDSRVPLNSGDAHSLLLAVGHQLASLRPELFDPKNLEVVVEQRLGRVAAGGRAVGIRVGELGISPFATTRLRVTQTADVVEGELAGLSVGHLVVDERLLELANLQYLALLDPASVLGSEQRKARIVILVDALDELHYHAGGDSALDWLANCPELPENVRFVLTSLPDDRLLERFRSRQEDCLSRRWRSTTHATTSSPTSCPTGGS
jgi:hypothetical protein